MSRFVVEPVGFVRGGRVEPTDDAWAGAVTIELAEGLEGSALTGLETFSHAVVVTRFHLADPGQVVRGARHPRGNTAWPEVGIFAQRGKDRPNHLGISTCRIVAVESTWLVVEGLDAVDGTPVLDIKPWVEQFGPRGERHQPPWMDELMARYWG